jgi:tetratricopeptide (TPR) repeat protein
MRRRLRDGRDGRALVEELERVGEALSSPAEKSHWLLELGVACEMLVPERQRALGLYCRAAELDASNSEALERGRMVSRELGRIDELIRLTELDLSRETDEARREHLSALIGESLLDLGDRQRAAAFLVGAAGQFPASLAIQDALGTVGYDDDWRAEIERLMAIGEEPDATYGARVALRAARIIKMEAPDDPRYERLLQRVLAHDPYDESAHMLLDGLYATQQRWDDLEDLQATLMQAFPGADEQAALCQRFSFSWIARGQHDRAAAWCWRAIELGRLVYPIAGLTMLRGIYGPARQWERLLAAIDALLGTPLDEDAAVHAALLGGTIAWKAIHDRERAAGYFARVRQVAVDSLLVIDFDDARADERAPETIGDEQRALMEAARRLTKSDPLDRHIEAWKKAIAADPTTRAPRRALARVLHVGERWRTLAEALKDEEANAARDDAGRVALLMQLAALYRDRLRQDLLATATLARVIELEPGNLGALHQLEQAYRQVRRWPDVVAVLAKKLQHVSDPAEQLALNLQLAAIWQTELNNEAEAVKAMEAALILDHARETPGPARAELDEKLERAYVRRREWDKLFALKQRRTETIGDPAARLAAYLELAQLATEKLKKPQLAIAAWQAVLATKNGGEHHEAALAALERLYAAAEAHTQLADIYERRAAQTADAAIRLSYLQKLALLSMEQLGDPERAMATWLNVLALQPGHGRALEMLRRLYVDQRQWDALEGLFAQDRRLDECARLFERQAPDEPLAEQVELWLRAGRLWQTLGRRADAQRAFEKVLQLDPADEDAVAALVALYEEGGDARKLAGALALQLGHDHGGGDDDDEALKKARLLRLAQLHARELHDPPGAFRWQLEAFTVDPGDLELRGELERLAARTGGWAALIERYQRVVAARPEDAKIDRLALLSTVAREQEALGDVDGALATTR